MPVPFGLILISAFELFVVIRASLIVNWLLPVPMFIALFTFSCPVPCGAIVMFAFEDPVAIVVPLPPVPVVSDSKSLPVPT